METKLFVRNCSANDLAFVQNIENSSFRDPFPPSLFLSFLSSYPLGFRVAVLDRDVVGYSILASARGKAEIESLAVKAESREKGIGTILLDDAIKLSKSLFKANSIGLQVRIDNSKAISLYSKSGFKQIGIVRNYYGRGKDALTMALKLE